MIYTRAEIVSINYQKAAQYYKKAADQRHRGAHYSLRNLYEVGYGIP